MRMSYRSLYSGSRRSGRRKRKPGRPGYLKFIGLLGIAMFVALGRIYLDRRTAEFAKEYNDRDRELDQLSREIANLSTERERYMRGDYILPRARRMGLRLTPPEQVRIIPDRGTVLATTDE